MEGFVLKGDIAYSVDRNTLATFENGYVVCKNGICEGVYEELPEIYANLPLIDYTGQLIVPGMTDLHTHAPQNAFRGMHMDLELMDWLNQHTFVEEAKYADAEYARCNYSIFSDNLKRGATTRAVIFGTIHETGTRVLMDLLEKTGVNCYVGLVCMDRNAPENLVMNMDNARITVDNWLFNCEKYENVLPIITPRFIPACSDEMLQMLGDMVKRHKLPVQSHLSENPGEIEFVKKLMPDAKFYGDGYSKYGLFGEQGKCIMAHCVHSVDDEIDRIKENGVYVAHCPSSNMNLSSGIAPIKKYLDMGMNVGLGTDVAGGDNDSIFNEIKVAIQVSKMRWRYVDSSRAGLTFNEAFYMATEGGGSFFGKCGSFKAGHEFDAIVINDSINRYNGYLSVENRLERCVYMNADRNGITDKYVKGRKIGM